MLNEIIFFWIISLISGLSIQMNWISQATMLYEISPFEAITRMVLGPFMVWLVIKGLDYLIKKIVSNIKSLNNELFLARYPKGYVVFAIPVLGMFGIRFPATNVIIIIFLFCIWVVWCIYQSIEKQQQKRIFSSNEWLAFLFFFSGFSALIYQVVWQRMLFTFFGVNIESVTLIVIIFMFGLGVGAIIGGFVSKIFQNHLPKIFLYVEIGIGFFGVFSGMIINWIGVATTNYSQSWMIVTVYAFLAFPTLCMGMTLPILVEYLERYMKNIGKSVGTLYSINTLGSAAACIITAEIFFVFFGQTISLWIAAFLNLMVGYLVYLFTKNIVRFTI
jgi:hypothetical protein